MGRSERFKEAQSRAYQTALSSKGSRGIELVAPTGSLTGPKPLGVSGRGLSLQSVGDRRYDGQLRREASPVTVSVTRTLSVPVSSTELPKGFVAAPEPQRPAYRGKASKVFQGVTPQSPLADAPASAEGIIGRTLVNPKEKA